MSDGRDTRSDDDLTVAEFLADGALRSGHGAEERNWNKRIEWISNQIQVVESLPSPLAQTPSLSPSAKEELARYRVEQLELEGSIEEFDEGELTDLKDRVKAVLASEAGLRDEDMNPIESSLKMLTGLDHLVTVLRARRKMLDLFETRLHWEEEMLKSSTLATEIIQKVNAHLQSSSSKGAFDDPLDQLSHSVLIAASHLDTLIDISSEPVSDLFLDRQEVLEENAAVLSTGLPQFLTDVETQREERSLIEGRLEECSRSVTKLLGEVGQAMLEVPRRDLAQSFEGQLVTNQQYLQQALSATNALSLPNHPSFDRSQANLAIKAALLQKHKLLASTLLKETMRDIGLYRETSDIVEKSKGMGERLRVRRVQMETVVEMSRVFTALDWDSTEVMVDSNLHSRLTPVIEAMMTELRLSTFSHRDSSAILVQLNRVKVPIAVRHAYKATVELFVTTRLDFESTLDSLHSFRKRLEATAESSRLGSAYRTHHAELLNVILARIRALSWKVEEDTVIDASDVAQEELKALTEAHEALARHSIIAIDSTEWPTLEVVTELHAALVCIIEQRQSTIVALSTFAKISEDVERLSIGGDDQEEGDLELMRTALDAIETRLEAFVSTLHLSTVFTGTLLRDLPAPSLSVDEIITLDTLPTHLCYQDALVRETINGITIRTRSKLAQSKRDMDDASRMIGERVRLQRDRMLSALQLHVDVATSSLSALLDSLDAVEGSSAADDGLLDAALEVAKDSVAMVIGKAQGMMTDAWVKGHIQSLTETLAEMEMMVAESKAARAASPTRGVVPFANLGSPPSRIPRRSSSRLASGTPQRALRVVSEGRDSADAPTPSPTSSPMPSLASYQPSDSHWISSSTLSKGKRISMSPSSASSTGGIKVTSKRKVDREVARVIDQLPMEIEITAVEELTDESGKYCIGDRIYFIRILRSQTAMVRVGGGWLELRSFLLLHFGSTHTISPSTSLAASHHGSLSTSLSRMSLSRSYSGEVSARRRSSAAATTPGFAKPARATWRP